MADSKEPEKRRAPVRKRLPIEADWKLKVEVGGRFRLRISRWRWERIERINIAWGVGMSAYKGDVPVRRVRNSVAAISDDGGRRWLKRLRMFW